MRIDPTRDTGPTRTLEQAIDRDCRDFRGGLKAVCAILDEPYDGFQKRLSVSYPEHRLHVDDFARVVELTQGDASRLWFEQVFSVVCYRPTAVAATKEALVALAELLSRESAFVLSLHEGADDSRWEPHEVADLEFHGNRVIEAVLGIMAGARQATEGKANG
ncbi:hypothetical protein [Pseudomonas sp. LFM046]|uniref:hypothetical protein n=1 Tax=Pseudomonas sp. LFM046 TaxID=1608357 RepID=UPI0005CFD90F|nr:hypothetical protein [Pseudomonas sp. LFM046]